VLARPHLPILCSLLAMALLLDPAGDAQALDVWLGTSRAEPSKGIYRCTLDTKTGELSAPELVAEVGGPGFLAMHPSGKQLYAVANHAGQASVVAYAVDASGPEPTLRYLNSVETGRVAHRTSPSTRAAACC
jgi:6-phosphogluconolactonase